MTARLSPQRETEETANRRADVRALLTHGGAKSGLIADYALDALIVAVRAEASAELAAVRAERDEARAELAKYVGREPTIAEEMAYLSRCLDAVRDLCDGAEEQAKRWETPLPVPEWVDRVRAAAEGTEAVTPRTERSYWVATAAALNAALSAGMPVGIDLDGTLTDRNAWSVIWDRDAEKWVVAGYDEEAAR